MFRLLCHFSVFEILLKVSEGKPWKETLLEVLPQRKFRTGGRQRKRKSQNSGEQTDSSDECDSDNESKHEENLPNDDAHSPIPSKKTFLIENKD